MTKETAEAIQEVGETMFACEIRNDYGGPGMYGVEVPSWSHFCTALVYAAIESRNQLDIAEETRKFQSDSVDRDAIIVY